MYRNREWNLEERQNQKINKKSNWWNSAKSEVQYKSVLFVTPTPGEVLAKEIRKRLEEINKNEAEKIKIVEKGGLKMRNVLGSKNPFKKEKCIQQTCPLCNSSTYIETNKDDIKIACNTHNVGYKWVCLTCQDKGVLKVYEGETGRSARTRGAEHVKDLEKKKQTGALYKHKLSEHKDENVKFQMHITHQFKDALTRQANEAV